jgi:hypothetical protein
VIWHSKACGSYHDFLDRGLLLTRKLLNQGFLVVKLKSSLQTFCGRYHDLVIRYGDLCNKWPRICSVCRNHIRSFPHSWLITWFVTRLTRRVPLVERKLPTLPEHKSSTSFLGFRVARSVVFCVIFCRSLFFYVFFFLWPLCFHSLIYKTHLQFLSLTKTWRAH